MHVVLFGATIFGFEIESGLHETRAAGFAKETVADTKFVERFLERLDLACGVDIFIVTRLYIVVARIFQWWC